MYLTVSSCTLLFKLFNKFALISVSLNENTHVDMSCRYDWEATLRGRCANLMWNVTKWRLKNIDAVNRGRYE